MLLGFGRACSELLPDCFCDACDLASPDLVEHVEDLVATASGGSSGASAEVRGEVFEQVWAPWTRRGRPIRPQDEKPGRRLAADAGVGLGCVLFDIL